MKASDLLVQSLEEEGVSFIFGVPGEENLDFLNSLRESKIQLILTRHEQAAGFMAATCGRLTGRAGVCLATLGPGATNLVTAAAYAQLGAMPMLMITGQKPVKRGKQGHFQIIDIVDMMKPLTKYTKQLISGDNIPYRVRETFRLIEEERPGAGHLELPEDVAAENASGAPVKRGAPRRPVAEDKAIAKAIRMIHQARNPILLVGAGANRKITCKMLRRFMSRTGIPAVSTQMGKGVVDEYDSLFIGCAALSEGDFVHRALEQADLIINVGHDVVEKPPFIMKPEHSRKVLHIDFSPAETDPVYFPQAEVIGDIGASVWRLSEGTEKQEHWDFSAIMKIKKAIDEHLLQEVDSTAYPLVPQRVVADVRAAMPPAGIITLDNGVYKIWFARNYRARQPNTILLDNALATMGAGLPSAMAAKILHPDTPTLAICGDGGFMMNSQELETAVRLKLNLTVMILRDNAYGMIKWKQAGMNFPDFGLDYGNPDFVKYADSYGAVGIRLERGENLSEVLKKNLASTGVHVLEVPVDYSDNHRILNREIKELAKAL